MDWKDITPLKEHEAIDIIQKYLNTSGFSPSRINHKNLPDGVKSPDLAISNNGELQFYCEVKTPELKLHPVTGMYHWDTTFYKLRRFIHGSVKQFKDVDPDHLYPRVVAFTSNHPQLNWTSFCHNVMGKVSYGETVIKNFRDKSFVSDSDKDLLEIDLFLWFQVNYINRTDVYQLYRYLNVDSKHISNVEMIANQIRQPKR